MVLQPIRRGHKKCCHAEIHRTIFCVTYLLTYFFYFYLFIYLTYFHSFPFKWISTFKCKKVTCGPLEVIYYVLILKNTQVYFSFFNSPVNCNTPRALTSSVSLLPLPSLSYQKIQQLFDWFTLMQEVSVFAPRNFCELGQNEVIMGHSMEVWRERWKNLAQDRQESLKLQQQIMFVHQFLQSSGTAV